MYVCSDHFEDDYFDSSWMLQSTLTYSDRPIQRRLCPGGIPTKFPYKPVKNDIFLNNVKRLIAKRGFFFLFTETVN